MNLTTKILLTIYLEGVLSQEKEDTIIVYQKSENYDSNNPFKDFDKKAKKIVENGTVHHLQRMPTKVKKKTSITKEAYDFWVDTVPDFWPQSKGEAWFRLPVRERVFIHCSRIAGNNPFTCEILED